MPKKVPTQILQERFEKAAKELKKRQQEDAQKMQEASQKRREKIGAIIEKVWNNNAPINPKIVSDILAEIAKNSATMNLISVRIKNAAAGSAKAETEPPESSAE